MAKSTVVESGIENATKVAETPLPPIDSFDILRRIENIGIHWWSIIDGVLETHQFHDRVYPDPVQPLLQWAVNRLKDQGRHSASETEFYQLRRLLKDWLHLAMGNGSQQRFEVWTNRGSRLAFRHESWEDANAALERLKPRFPDAFVARVHVLSTPAHQSDPALLDTMIGEVSHIGTFMMSEEEEYTVQDETGRQVTVAASVLRRHPVYERLNERGRESLDFYLERTKPHKKAIRKAVKKDMRPVETQHG